MGVIEGRVYVDTCYKLLYTFLIKTLLRIVLRVGVPVLREPANF